MSIAFIADVHLANHKQLGGTPFRGVNLRAQRILDALDQAAQAAFDCEARTLVILGDLLDKVMTPPQLLTELMGFFSRWHGSERFENIVILKGNHESVSDQPRDHALGVFGWESLVIGQPRRVVGLDVDLWVVPYCSGAAIEWLPKVLEKMSEQRANMERGDSGNPKRDGVVLPRQEIPRVLALHVGISDEKTPPWLRDAPDSVPALALAQLAAEHGITHVFAGNWHDARSWHFPDLGVQIHQVGALVPTGWDNPGIGPYGQVALLDENGDVSKLTVPGPRFVEVHNETELKRLLTWVSLHDVESQSKLFVRWKEAGDLQKARETLTTYLMNHSGHLYAGEVVPALKHLKEASHKAAGAAKKASTLREAVAHYVDKMPLQGVDRAAVMDRTLAYLGMEE